MTGLDRTIVALDNMTYEESISFLKMVQGQLKYVKIGMELFYKYGQSIVKQIHDQFNMEIFLDLKIHDIPNTVSKSISSLQGLPIKFLTIHLAGGLKMLESAVSQASCVLPNTNLLGVSFLTSLNESDFQDIYAYNKNQIGPAFKRLFLLACKSKIQGVILSPLELTICKEIETQCSHQLIKITPGIRFQDEIQTNNVQDQARVMTPEQAISQGASFMVVGRSLTQSPCLHKRLDYLRSLELA